MEEIHLKEGSGQIFEFKTQISSSLGANPDLDNFTPLEVIKIEKIVKKENINFKQEEKDQKKILSYKILKKEGILETPKIKEEDGKNEEKDRELEILKKRTKEEEKEIENMREEKKEKEKEVEIEIKKEKKIKNSKEMQKETKNQTKEDYKKVTEKINSKETEKVIYESEKEEKLFKSKGWNLVYSRRDRIFEDLRKLKKKEDEKKGKMAVEEIEKIWDKVDVNKDGELDEDEIRKVFLGMGKDFTKIQIKSIMREIDVDGSGTVSKIEFLSLMNKESEISPEKILESFSFFSNDQGILNINSFRKILTDLGELLSQEDIRNFAKIMRNYSKDGIECNVKEMITSVLSK